MKFSDVLEDLRLQHQRDRHGDGLNIRTSRQVVHRTNLPRAIERNFAIGLHLSPRDQTGLLGESSTKRPREEDDLEALHHSDVSRCTPTLGKGSSQPQVTDGPRLPIIFNGKQQDLLELLNSDEWKRYTADLHGMDSYMDAEDYEIPSNILLQTTPKKWQAIGQEKLVKLARSPFRGGFLADPVGLGKSLTALLAALRIKMDHSEMGYILVVCRTGCLVQWFDEIRTHFAKERRPKALILDTPDYPVRSLLHYDVVICSQSYVRSRYKEAVAFEAERASQVTNPSHKAGSIKRPHWPLHSHLYAKSGKVIPAIIIDESQDAKGLDSVLLKAIKSLQYHAAFLLSGTPVHNLWTDLYAQMSILPGCPFQDFDHFSEICCGVDPNGMLMSDPDDERRQILIGLLSGMVIKRPKAIVGLPDYEHTLVEVPLTVETHKEVITLIRTLTKKGLNCLRLAGEDQRHRLEHLQRGLSLLNKAMGYSLCPILVEYSKKLDANPKDQEMETAGPDEGVDDEETVEIPPVAADLLVVNEELNMAGDVDVAVRAPIIDDNADPDMDPQTATDHTKAEPKEDPDEAWTRFLSNAEDDKIFTPRIQATIDLLAHLRQYHPEEKIVITAESLKILDVVNEAITRKRKSSDGPAGLFDIGIAVYNGRISSIDTRAEIIRNFNKPAPAGPSILLMTAASGGTGLNIHGASRLIFLQVLWSPGLRDQIIGRLHRMPQVRIVHTYQMFASQSAIDKHVDKRASAKAGVRGELMEPLEKSDNAAYIVPRLPERGALRQQPTSFRERVAAIESGPGYPLA